MADQDFRERVLESLARIESQARENNARLEKRLDSLDTRVGTLERDVIRIISARQATPHERKTYESDHIQST